MLEQLKNCKILFLAINLSFTVKYLLLLSTTHSQLPMANPKLLGTDNTILREKKTQDLRNVGYVEDESQTCPKSRMTEASRDHTDLSQHFTQAEEPLVELSLHLTYRLELVLPF